MLRTTLAAGAAIFLAMPAAAQTVDEQLSAAPWTCWMNPLNGDPGADLMLHFEGDATLYASFYFEIPQDGNLVSVDFDATGSWSLNGSVIAMDVDAAELVGAWINDEEVDEATRAEMEGALIEGLVSFSGESTIAYISAHAMVVEEPEASISCWR